MTESGDNRLVAKDDIVCPGATIEDEIKSGQVGEEPSPELRIDGRSVSEGAKLDPVLLKKIRIEKLFSLTLHEER